MPSFARTGVRVAVALAMVLGSAPETRAEPLLSRGAGSVVALPGVSRAIRVTVGRTALAALRAEAGATRVDDFPLGGARTVALELRRFAPVGPHTRVDVMESDGPHRIAMPDAAYFTGAVAGEPESRALVVAMPDAVHGFVASGGELFRFGPDAGGTHRTYSLGDVEPGAYPPPEAFCVNDAHPELDMAAPPVAGAPAPPVAATGMRVAQVAIETDRELRLKFPSDQAALAYLGELLAAASAIYERDVSVRLTFSYIRLWGASPADPWSATEPSAALNEVRAYWLDPTKDMASIAGPRDLVHFLSGKAVKGGVAYLDVLCNPSYGFGVSQVQGNVDVSSPSNIWDVLVLTHEMGHNFGSPHTHCYAPPVDRCYNAESGCYDGAVVSSRGTIMSYCHLTGGLSNVDLVFGSTVAGRIAPSVENASCLTVDAPACGNGIVESGEQCDDGNRSSGDCCSASCQAEACVSTTTSSTSTTTSHTTPPPPTITTSTTVASTSSTTMIAPAGDADGDGVGDDIDACPGSVAGELVDGTGCAVCPCEATRDGTPWPSRVAYARCLRAELRRRARLGAATRRPTARAIVWQRRVSTCGSDDLTRCCVYKTSGAAGECRVLRPARCNATKRRAASVLDVGPGTCAVDSCAR